MSEEDLLWLLDEGEDEGECIWDRSPRLRKDAYRKRAAPLVGV
jgi:hypothetical protein